jgi:hypothetical protein
MGKMKNTIDYFLVWIQDVSTPDVIIISDIRRRTRSEPGEKWGQLWRRPGGVERMEVEEDINLTKASAGRFKEKLTSAAREGWSKVMNRLRGRELKREGSELVVEKMLQSKGGEGGKVLLSEEVRGKWMEESEVGRVDVEVVVEEREMDLLSVRSSESKKTKAGFGFLEKMEDEERD